MQGFIPVRCVEAVEMADWATGRRVTASEGELWAVMTGSALNNGELRTLECVSDRSKGQIVAHERHLRCFEREELASHGTLDLETGKITWDDGSESGKRCGKCENCGCGGENGV